MEFLIKEVDFNDWEQISKIYLDGINTKIATFQNEVPTWEDWQNSHVKECSIVAKSKDKVLGFATLSKVSNKLVYSGVAEVSIYIDCNSKGNGVGTKLLNELIILSEKKVFGY